MPRHSPDRIELSEEERAALESLARSYTLPYWQVTRAQMVLMAAEGLRNDQIAAQLRCGRDVWRKRFFEQRMAGLEDRPRRGRPPAFPPQVRAEVIRLACERPAQSDVPLARAVGGGAAIEQLRAECVPGSEVTQGAASLILVLDALAALDGRRGGQRGVLAVPRLDRGFLIAADDVVAGMQ